jgi:hypothetical protein
MSKNGSLAVLVWPHCIAAKSEHMGQHYLAPPSATCHCIDWAYLGTGDIGAHDSREASMYNARAIFDRATEVRVDSVESRDQKLVRILLLVTGKVLRVFPDTVQEIRRCVWHSHALCVNGIRYCLSVEHGKQVCISLLLLPTLALGWLACIPKIFHKTIDPSHMPDKCHSRVAHKHCDCAYRTKSSCETMGCVIVIAECNS